MMSLFPVPPPVEKRIDAFNDHFLWFGNKDKRGSYLVKWKTDAQQTSRGGLV